MKFIESGFMFHGGYLMYDCGADRRFVARFKYDRTAMGPFKTFLKKNFEVEEYMTMLEDGMTPVKALETKGYITPSMKRMCKKMGVEPTMANYIAALKVAYA
jgi:hypothetical protein